MRCIDRFCRDETGSVTIEFILWIPLIMALVALVVDATTIYITHTEMQNVARDTARRMVKLKGIMTEKEIEAFAMDYATEAIRLRDAPYAAEVDYDESKNVAQVIIRIHVEDATIIGSWSLANPLTLIGGDMSVNVIMRPGY